MVKLHHQADLVALDVVLVGKSSVVLVGFQPHSSSAQFKHEKCLAMNHGRLWFNHPEWLWYATAPQKKQNNEFWLVVSNISRIDNSMEIT